MNQIAKSIFSELLRNRAIAGYLLFMGITGWGIFFLEGYPEKAYLSLMQVILFVIPLMSIVFSNMFYYSSQEFILLLLAQPISRKRVIRGVYIGLVAGFCFAYVLGICIPLFIFYPGIQSVFLLLTGILLTSIFTACGILIGVLFDDKARGMGVCLVVWTLVAFLFDGMLLVLMYQFSMYPIEKLVLILTLLNPIDIGRILLLLQTDISAIMGLSTAVFQNILGSTKGQVVSVLMLVIWTLGPLFLARKFFERKNF